MEPLSNFNTVLPNELQLTIFGYLPVTQVCKNSSVCKWWKTLNADSALWKRLWLHTWGDWVTPSFDSLTLKEKNWKQLYREWWECAYLQTPYTHQVDLVWEETIKQMQIVGTYLAASCYGSGSVRIFDLKHMRPLPDLQLSDGIHPNLACYQKWLLIAAEGIVTGDIQMWDIEKRAVIKTLKGHKQAVLALKTEGIFLASVGSDRSLRVWNMVTTKQEACFRFFDTISVQGDYQLTMQKPYIAFACIETGSVYVWDYVQKKRVMTYRLQNQAIEKIALIEHYLIITSNGRAYILDVQTNKLEEMYLHPQRHVVLDLHVLFSTNLQADRHPLLLCASSYDNIQFLNCSTRTCIYNLSLGEKAYAIQTLLTVNKTYLCLGTRNLLKTSDGNLYIWNLTRKELVQTCAIHTCAQEIVSIPGKLIVQAPNKITILNFTDWAPQA